MSVSVTIDIDGEPIRKGIQEFSRLLGQEAMMDDVELIAEELLRRAIDSPIPSDTRALAHSGVTVRKKDHVTLGFNKVYAAFQDAPGKMTPHVIVPKRKRILYIPISSKGRRLHRYGNNPSNEGLIRGVDYILSPRVVIPIKAYGSAVGPNHYFSETIRRNQEFTFNTIAKLGSRRLAKRFKPKPGGSGKGDS